MFVFAKKIYCCLDKVGKDLPYLVIYTSIQYKKKTELLDSIKSVYP